MISGSQSPSSYHNSRHAAPWDESSTNRESKRKRTRSPKGGTSNNENENATPPTKGADPYDEREQFYQRKQTNMQRHDSSASISHAMQSACSIDDKGEAGVELIMGDKDSGKGVGGLAALSSAALMKLDEKVEKQ